MQLEGGSKKEQAQQCSQETQRLGVKANQGPGNLRLAAGLFWKRRNVRSTGSTAKLARGRGAFPWNIAAAAMSAHSSSSEENQIERRGSLPEPLPPRRPKGRPANGFRRAASRETSRLPAMKYQDWGIFISVHGLIDGKLDCFHPGCMRLDECPQLQNPHANVRTIVPTR